MPHIDIVFEGEAPNLKFVEVENERGESVQVGVWVVRPDGSLVPHLGVDDARVLLGLGSARKGALTPEELTNQICAQRAGY